MSIRMPESHVSAGLHGTFFTGSNVHKEKKEWGEEHWIVNRDYCGKKLILRKNRRCSLHMHKEKDEVFYLQSGSVLLELGKKKYTMKPGDFVHVRANMYHRFTGLEDSEIMEFSTHHEEYDSYRKEFSGHVEPVRFARQSAIIKKFTKLCVVVIGDVMLDAYLAGSVDRVSPEAPVPVVRAQSHLEVPGGAANVASGMAALGAQVNLISACGSDETGKKLERFLIQRGIKTSFHRIAGRPTTRKERITAMSGQQIVRVDVEMTDVIPVSVEKKLISALTKAAKKADAILVSDYAKGVLTPAIMKAAYAAGKRHKIPVIVDPKPQGSSPLAGLKDAAAITPNLAEARKLLDAPRMTEEKVGPMLSKKLKGSLVLTRGGAGMDVYSKGKLKAHSDAHSAQVVDVSGAGDTVAAVIALGLAAGGSIEDAADIGNRAAGVVVQKRGTATVTTDELLSAL